MSIKSIALDVMKELEKTHPAFLIESHFQCEFALALNRLSTMDINLEVQLKTVNSINGHKYRVDLIASDIKTERKFAFEFKYHTTQTDINVNGITYHLKKQGGQKERKVDIWKDISKLEGIKNAKECDEACFILLTNDRKDLISSKARSGAIDIDAGKHEFPSGELVYTEKSIQHVIKINGTYDFKYEPYKTGHDFEYLIVEI